MSLTAFNPRALLADAPLGVLATLRSNGRPQLSPVMFGYDPDPEVVHITADDKSAKVANVRRDPRAAFEVTSTDGRSWATAEGTATVVGPAADPNGPEADALVHYYRVAAGEHPNWDEYRAVVVAERRVLIALTVERVYGARIS